MVRNHERESRPAVSPVAKRSWWWCTVLLLAVTGGISVWRNVPEHRFQDVVSTSAGRANESRCGECHEQARTFAETGHARTLLRASAPDSERLLKMLESSKIAQDEAVRVELAVDGPRSVTTVQGVTYSMRLDWCFGSGAHARTWISTLPDSSGATDLLESRWSWFHQINDFDITPGQSEHRGRGSIAVLGLQYDGPRAFRCFSCHASVVPVEDGRIDEDGIVPGVTCQRCHGPMQKHVDTEGQFHDPAWSVTDRMGAVNRCAQCHRRADEQPPDEIRADNPDIARFQPVGLVQSACFQKSSMTCTTCHDPHRAHNSEAMRNIAQCTQCHNTESGGSATCGAERRDGCFDCHMPRVSMEAPLSFTDHWIRVRTPREPRP